MGAVWVCTGAACVIVGTGVLVKQTSRFNRDGDAGEVGSEVCVGHWGEGLPHFFFWRGGKGVKKA